MGMNKNARNERRKITATLLNAMAASWLSGALLVPHLHELGHFQSWHSWAALVVIGAVALLLHSLARRAVRDLED
jgi:hypothetical protein